MASLSATCGRVNTVFITGGTHGNEKNGVQLARHLQRNPALCERPSFKTQVVITNVAAVEKNVRYVEEDMNRCFLRSELEDPKRTDTIEARRAKEINQLIGPKGSASPNADYVIDLHNTTAATGVALMMAPGDELSHSLGAHLVAEDPSVRICNWKAGLADYPMLPSVGKHGMTFEVGPCSWGCVDSASYAQSLALLKAALDYLHAHNLAVDAASDSAWRASSVLVHSLLLAVDYPRDEHGELSAVIHPSLQGKDFQPLRKGAPAFLALDGSSVVPFAGSGEEGSGDDDVSYPFFINEAAYYEKKIAFMLARRTQRPVTIAASVPRRDS